MCLLIYLTICLISNVYISFIVGLLVGLVTYAIICRLFNCPELKHISKIMIHIVCGIDDKFVMPCGVLMSSVLK